MDFILKEEHRMLREMVREFVNNDVKPVAGKIDEDEQIPESLMQKAKELGLFGVSIPQEYGGAGMGEIGYCVMLEELAHGCNSLAGVIGGHLGLSATAIASAGTHEQKQKYLPSMSTGEKIGCYALSEPNAGSDAQNIQTTAIQKGDRWILTGQKIWITNADIADIFIVYAANDKNLKAYGGITAFIVERGFKGLRVGKVDEKMGLKGMHSPEVFLDDCEVPAENVLGRVGEGFKVAMHTLNAGRISLGAACIGTAKECIDLSIKYAQQRVTFGQPIINHQAIQFMLSEMATITYTMESIAYRTAYMYDLGQKVHREAAMVKYYCTDAVSRVIDHAIQIHGGMGYMKELPLERFYRDARVNRIFEGTNEIQKILIARDLAKKGAY